MKFERDWKEEWIERMGLIVALSGFERFEKMREFKRQLNLLPSEDVRQVHEAIKRRFTPTNGNDGCQEATKAVREAAI